MLEKTTDTPFILDRVDSKPYMEIYFFKLDDQEIRVQVTHDSAGIFSDFKLIGAETEEAKSLLATINEPYERQFRIDYTPAHQNLEKLYSIMQEGCDSSGVSITNIVDYPAQYYTIYYLRTSGISAYLQFYLNGKNQLTRAIPKSFIGEQDEKLNQLINTISEYAI
jgi:hypothetical protein